jgi:hypothetical protein
LWFRVSATTVALSHPTATMWAWTMEVQLPIARGLILRSVLVLLLLERRQPMRVSELVIAVRGSGFAVFGRPSKEIADALRWEVARAG